MNLNFDNAPVEVSGPKGEVVLTVGTDVPQGDANFARRIHDYPDRLDITDRGCHD